MKSSKFFLAAFLFLVLPFRLLAWGREGHQIVAKLAMLQLSESTKNKVLQVLGTMTPEEASTWMDDVRGDVAYKYTAPWHYTNIEEGQTYKPAANGDIITALNKAYAELQHLDTLSPQRLRFDVQVLFHLCGDILQPLHVGYGSDKGGNDYQVQYNGKGTNLHHLWDSEIIESQNITLQSLIDSNSYSSEDDIKQIRRAPVNFMRALEYGRNELIQVYGLDGHKVSDKYLQDSKFLISYDLKAGASLLAICLEHLFNQAKNIPIEKTTANTNLQDKTDTVYQELLPKVPAEQAANYIGKKVVVCGKVYSAKFQGGSGVTFINMGGEYPNNTFTAVIMANNRSNFNYKPEEYLNGKTICVLGTIKEYKGKPEIVVERQVEILVQ